MPPFTKEYISQTSHVKVRHTLKHIKTKPATIPGDIPANILKHITNHISIPMNDIINSCIEKGEWPDVWKIEAVTQIPKVHPAISVEDLRNISGLANLKKVTEKNC